MSKGKTSAIKEKEVREALGVFLRPIERFRKNPRRALAAPRTALARLEEDVHTELSERLDSKSIDDTFLRMLHLLPESEHEALSTLLTTIEGARSELRCEFPGAQLLSLYDAADRAGPHSPFKFIFSNPDEEPQDRLVVLGKLDELRRAKDERRVQTLLEAAPDILERIYLRYVRGIWSLSFLAEGSWPSRPPARFGALVASTVSRVRTFPDLVDPDAGHLRNAVAHRHFKPRPLARVIRFHEVSSTWGLTLTDDAFEEKLLTMWHVSTTLLEKLRSIAAQEFWLRIGMLRVLFELRGNPTELTKSGDSSLYDSRIKDAIEAEVIRRPPPEGTDLWFLDST